MPLARAAVGDLTRAYYEVEAEAYATATFGGDMESAHREFAGLLEPGALVLDVGCGSGRDLAALSACGLAMVGLDFSAPMATIARRRSGCPVIVADLRSIPIGSGCLDGLWASASLHHVAHRDLAVALRECRRVVRRGSPFYASVKSGVGERVEDDGRFFSLHGPAQWREALATAGFVGTLLRQVVETRQHPGGERRVDWIGSTAIAT